MPHRDPEKRKQYQKEYREKNKEKLDEYYREWAKKHGGIGANQRFRRYGITPEAYETMRVAQSLKCAICRKAVTLVVDHCHETGKVRGLLCKHCNSVLGYARDDTSVLRAAIGYIESNSEPEGGTI